MVSVETMVLKPRKILPTHAQEVRCCQNKHCCFLNCLNLHLPMFVSPLPCRRADLFSRHTTSPTWALFNPEGRGMWPFLVISGILQLALSCASVVPVPVCSVTACCALWACVWGACVPVLLQECWDRHKQAQMHHTGRFQRYIFIVPGIGKPVNISSASTKLLLMTMHPRFVSSKNLMTIISPVFSFLYGCGPAVLYCVVLFSCSKAALYTLSY